MAVTNESILRGVLERMTLDALECELTLAQFRADDTYGVDHITLSSHAATIRNIIRVRQQ